MLEAKVSINVSGKSFEILDSRTNLMKRRVSDSDVSVNESTNNFPLSLSEDVGAHALTTVGKSLSNFSCKTTAPSVRQTKRRKT